MNLFGMMETSGGAMQAERIRAEVVAANMANAETTRTATGGPYKRQHVVFEATAGGGQPSGVSTSNLVAGQPGFSQALASAAGPGFSSSSSSTNSEFVQPTGGLNVTDRIAFPTALPSLPSLSGSVAPGVEVTAVVEDKGQPLKRYDPGHPDAGADGYVSYPDINPLTEMVDLMGATRAYGLNSSAVQAEKAMIGSALDIARS